MNILSKIDEFKDEIIRIRRHIHEYPDLSGEEKATRDFLKLILENAYIKCKTFENHYALVCDIIVYEKAPFIAFRADMDALPLKEENNKPYASKKDGVMHACGHDGHCAILAGVMLFLNKHKHFLKKNIRAIFQHKEEVFEGGSVDLIKDGVLEGVEKIYGLHMYPYLKTGEIGYKYGEMMASADMFEIEIFGKSAHGARPHEGVDAILVASSVVGAINHIVSRRIDPLHPAVISFGTINGGKAANIISDYVKLSGTVRTLNDKVRNSIKEMISKAVREICDSYDAKGKMHYYYGNSELVNHKECVDDIIKAAKKLNIKAVDLQTPVMGGEDFAEYLKVVKGAYFRLGCCNEKKNTCFPQHHPKFDIDEDSLIIGAEILAALALEAV